MTLSRNTLVCRCYFVKNYFIKVSGEGFHIDYVDKDHLLNSSLFHDITQNIETEELQNIFAKLELEKQRRNSIAKQSQERIMFIKKHYLPLVPHIYTLNESYLQKEFLDIVEMCKSSFVSTSSIFSCIKLVPGSSDIYGLPIFTNDFCKSFVGEIENFQNSSMPKGRPNSMNNYGVLLEEIGFYENFMNPLREFYLNPICKRLYPEFLKNTTLNSQKAFIVTYRVDGDIDLDVHFDNSEVTCNISLSKDFLGGELYFQENNGEDNIPYEHKLGWGLFHLGSKLHGSMSIVSGTRHNMIVWMRSSLIRNRICPMCQEKPHLVEVDGTGDGFTKCSLV